MGFFLRREVRSGGLKIEQVVRVFLLDDIARGVHLGMQGIESDHLSLDIQGLQGRFDGGDFAPFGGDFHLI